MYFITLLFVAAGLSMDAFAAAVTCGLFMAFSSGKRRIGDGIKIAVSFGLFQGIMPLIGYTVTNTFSDKVAAIDHWIAFVLLAFVGGHMVYAAIKGNDDDLRGDPARWDNLLVMSVATSIDALAVGASFAVQPKIGLLAPSYGILICCAVIALVTCILSLSGVLIGFRFGGKFGKKAEFAGGLILIGIGIKILLEHTVFSA